MFTNLFTTLTLFYAFLQALTVQARPRDVPGPIPPSTGIRHSAALLRHAVPRSSTADFLVANTERIRRRYGRSSDADVSLLDIRRRATPEEMSIAGITGGYYETNYYVNVSIGTPYVFVRSSLPVHENHPERRRPQHFRMVIDTGFPDTWVAAPCDAFDCPTGIAFYNSSKSSTAVNKTTLRLLGRYSCRTRWRIYFPTRLSWEASRSLFPSVCLPLTLTPCEVKSD
jgi:hypothetical protein